MTSYFFFEKIFDVKKEGIAMYQERIVLSPKEILEKEFKLDTRGYRPQEVDKFLDTVISDYEEMFASSPVSRLSPFSLRDERASSQRWEFHSLSAPIGA